jgi:UDPglucose 6-dehydrogenase
MVEKVAGLLGEIRGKTIAVLGVTFKPNTDDVRESPSLEIIPELQRRGASIRVHDPVVTALPGVHNVIWCKDAYGAAEGADCILLLTEWNEYRDLDFKRLSSVMRSRAFVDCRNVYDPRDVHAQDFLYTGVGRSYEASAPWKLEDVVVRDSDDAIPRPEFLSEGKA